MCFVHCEPPTYLAEPPSMGVNHVGGYDRVANAGQGPTARKRVHRCRMVAEASRAPRPEQRSRPTNRRILYQIH